MTWSEFAGSGLHNWLIIATLVVLVALVWVFTPEREQAEPKPLTYTTLDCRGGVHGGCEVCACSCHLHVELAWHVAHERGLNARAEGFGYTR